MISTWRPANMPFVLNIALLVKLGIKHLLTAHRTYPCATHNIHQMPPKKFIKSIKWPDWATSNYQTFGISTSVTVLAVLMHLLLANDALSISIRSPPARNKVKSKLRNIKNTQNHTWKIIGIIWPDKSTA